MLWPATKFLFEQISSFALTNNEYKLVPMRLAYFLPKFSYIFSQCSLAIGSM